VVAAALTALTELGDLALMVPISVAVGAWLLIVRARRVAAWWVLALGFCACSTAILKMVFYACPPDPGLVSPSGHTSTSVLIYGSLAIILGAETGRRGQLLIGIGGLSLVLAIASSRVMLGVHSAPEVALGSIVGFAALAVFSRAYLRNKPQSKWLGGFVAVLVALIILLHGQEVVAERLLHRITTAMNLRTLLCRAGLTAAGADPQSMSSRVVHLR
jgi:membrane-associated phospholipid phosphatase